MRFWRQMVGAIVIALTCVVVALVWPRSAHTPAAAAPTTTTTTSTTTTTIPKPVHAFEAADAAVPDVALYESPDAPAPFDSMTNPTIEHVALAFLVKSHGPPGWLQVQYSRRPNESVAWIHASDVVTRPVDNRIVVQREERILTVYRGTSDDVLFQAPVADGAPRTPTPLGHFFVDVVVKLSHTTGAYGPYQISVAGFSDVLQSFGGGPGQIAIHGTNHPELIGEFVSNGCVRMNNDDATALAQLAPVGTPVEIVA